MLYFSPWKVVLILGVVLLGFFFSLPNFVPAENRYVDPANPDQTKGIWTILPSQTVNLGLDLRGGSHLVFEVDIEDVRQERLGDLAEEARVVLRNDPPIFTARPAVVGQQVVIRVTNPEDLGAAYERLRELNGPVTGANGGQSLDQRLSITQDDSDRTIRIAITEAEISSIRQRTVEQSIEVIRRRIDATGTTEPTITRQDEDRVLVQVPGESDPQRVIDLVGTTARMTFHMVDRSVQVGPDGQARTPPDVMILPSDDGYENFVAVKRRAVLSGENLASASQSFDQNGQPAVAFRFDTTGSQVFGEITSQNVGERFAIVLDGVVITAPRIRSPILGGSGIIEGSFTVQEASDLSTMLSAGALPAKLTPVEQRSITASMGQDAIEAGAEAILLGFALVIVFMVLAYGFMGVVSTTALLINVLLILGALSGLQATLTLPGIAGIILTIGMAVDANVLIFERIREEIRQGRKVINAIEIGYNRAFAAILDANVTTFIAAAVLFMMGAGPVRGFAVTLGIGIVTSVFTAFTFSRFVVAVWLRLRKPQSIGF
ncbi:protein translocase subunit SecD [Woodsholea maritima]|uniref:protein translocase subunit SecD n=1 Tax=Woodsholea maritima TaxID=240237 RepID=UPI00035D04C6|nr:protein translocase subunit SecD [Woodsholea maritima]